LQGSQLVAEGQILEDDVVVATAGDGDGTQEQQRQFKHVRSCRDWLLKARPA
jgi:hypothetical protein